MKKIKNHQQLIAEKRRLLQQQQMLEQKIHGTWNDLKETLKPKNIAANLFSNMLDSFSGKQDQTLSDKAGQLAGAFTKIAVEKLQVKLSGWLKKIL